MARTTLRKIDGGGTRRGATGLRARDEIELRAIPSSTAERYLERCRRAGHPVPTGVRAALGDRRR